MLNRMLVVTCVVALWGARGLADEAFHEKAVIELLDVLQLKQNMTGGAVLADAMVQGNPQLEPYRDLLVKWATTTMTWEAMSPDLIALYKQELTEPEIRELIVFFKTKTGKKWVTAMPDLMRQESAIQAKIAQAHHQELLQMINQRTEELKKQDKQQPPLAPEH